MRKIFVYFLLLMIFPNAVFANEVSDPYILTNSINALPVKKEDCQILIQTQFDSINSDTAEQPSLSNYQQQLAELETKFHDLNRFIDDLETNEDYSIQQATESLNLVIEQLYQYYLDNDETFAYLNEDEQLILIENDENVIAWQQYLAQIISERNEAIVERNLVEQEYQELLYFIETETTVLEQENDYSEQLNQCLLYAYSVQKFPVESYMLNQQSDLKDYLVQVDQLLQKLVPYAYRKVSFEDILRLYQRRLDEEALKVALLGKQNVVIDALAMEQYSYERELNIFDIEIVSNLAQQQYLKTLDQMLYSENYQTMINLKEMQFAYFESLNASIWERLKEDVATYLNSGQRFDEETIQAIRQLHQKNQVKLVLFNEEMQNWEIVGNQSSGYFEEMIAKTSFLEEYETYQEIQSIDETTTHDLPETTRLESETTVNNLDFLKNKLANQSTTQTTNEKPTFAVPNRKKQGKETSKKSSDNRSVQLPSTGEQRQVMTVAIVILLIGVVLIWVSYKKKRQHQAFLDEIDLD